jgi:hypothetical protein
MELLKFSLLAVCFLMIAFSISQLIRNALVYRFRDRYIHAWGAWGRQDPEIDLDRFDAFNPEKVLGPYDRAVLLFWLPLKATVLDMDKYRQIMAYSTPKKEEVRCS